MKKFLLACAVALGMAATASAQNLYVGGELGFWHDGATEDSYATNKITFLPEIGFNFSDKFALGTVIGYDYTAICRTGVSNNIFKFEPYARYTYFKSESNFVSLFVDGAVGFGAGWTKYDDESSKTATVWNIGLRPGVALNFNEKFSFVAHVGFLGYEGANKHAKYAGYNNKGGLLLNNNNISFGFYYNF